MQAPSRGCANPFHRASLYCPPRGIQDGLTPYHPPASLASIVRRWAGRPVLSPRRKSDAAGPSSTSVVIQPDGDLWLALEFRL